MTLARFTQLWRALVTDRPPPSRPCDDTMHLVHLPASPGLVAILCKETNGDSSGFDEIERRLAEHDSKDPS